jgi:hypothetical protein
VEINMATKSKQGKGDTKRSVAIGNLGKVGMHEFPSWDACPDPCNQSNNWPHGGGNKDLCKLYKEIVKGYPAINTKGFQTKAW